MTFTWATVTAIGPLRIRLDGDTAPLPFTPDSLIDPLALAVTDRVRCEWAGTRLVIHGVAGGANPAAGWFPAPVSLGATDLNTLTSSGDYYQGTAANATLARNYPIATIGGILEVTAWGTDAVQHYTTRSDTNGTWKRVYRSGTGWTAWKRIAEEGSHGIPFAMASGIAPTAGAGGNSPPVYWDAGTVVTLPVGRFTVAPNVVVATFAGGQVQWGSLGATSPSTTSFTIRTHRIGVAPSATNHWIAVQMTEASASG